MFEVPRSEWDDGEPIGSIAAEELDKLDRMVPELRSFALSGDAMADAVRFFQITESPQMYNIEQGSDPLRQLSIRRDQLHQSGKIEEFHTTATRRAIVELEPLELQVIDRILDQAKS